MVNSAESNKTIRFLINDLSEYCDNNLSNMGYQDYIEENLGEALDVVSNEGCLLDLDNILHLKSILGINVSYSLYSFLNSCYDDSLLDLTEEDKEELIGLLYHYIGLDG